MSMSCAKTDEPIKGLLGLQTRVGPRNHVLSGSADPPNKGALLGITQAREAIVDMINVVRKMAEVAHVAIVCRDSRAFIKKYLILNRKTLFANVRKCFTSSMYRMP